MKNILGIIGSSRKAGNCELIIEEIYRNIKLPSNLSLLRLSDFNIKACKGCYKCLFKKQECVIQDEINQVIESIIVADALILTAPTYFLSSHSSLKCFIDRSLLLYPHIDMLWRKPSIGVAIAGIKGKEGSTLLGIENFLKIIMSDIKQTEVIYGALPGEVLLNLKNKEIAKSLGENLFDKFIKKHKPHCNLCGGETFRFLEHGKVRCMLCSNSGTIRIDKEGNNVLSICRENPDFFLNRKNVIEHRKWLIKMKDNFVLKQKLLKEVTEEYNPIKVWIKPK